jgi:hypothetical protein
LQQRAGTPNIRTIERTFPCKIKAHERANRDNSNNAICILIRLVIVKLLGELWVGRNVGFLVGCGVSQYQLTSTVVLALLQKCTLSGRKVKILVIFEKGI